MLKIKEFYSTYPLFGEGKRCGNELVKFVNENKIQKENIIAINRDYDGFATLWYWEDDAEEIKRAVAQVCLKPGDPLDPEGVFNE